MDLLLYLNADGKVSVILLLLILLWTTFGMTKALPEASDVPANAAHIEHSGTEQSLSQAGPFLQQVSVRQLRKDLQRSGAGHLCGGTLISDNAVLTAAHCFVDRTKGDGSFLAMDEFTVVLGIVSLQLKELLMPLAQFDLHSYDKDIALIILHGIVPPSIVPIQLARVTSPAQASCQISGWNSTAVEYYLAQMHSYNVTLTATANCMVSSVSGAQSKPSALRPGMLCASNADEVASVPCTAESGGPLLCAGQLVGIGSWGIECGRPGLAGVYTDVSHYRAWILDNVRQHKSNATLANKPARRSNENAFHLKYKIADQLVKSAASAVNRIRRELFMIFVVGANEAYL